MKKKFYFSVFAIGFSAFAFRPSYCNSLQCRANPAKTVKKRVHKPSATPIADVVISPILAG